MERYRLRLERRRWRVRAWRKRRELSSVSDRTARIRAGDILAVCVLRNERVRLPYFLSYYRKLGIGHFLFVDNGSDDGSADYLAAQADVSLWTTGASYKRARFGMDWVTALLNRHARQHWALIVDSDEFFVYPFCDTRPLRALTDWLDSMGLRTFGTMVLDMYPKGTPDAVTYREGQDPFEILPWFDSGNYSVQRNPHYQNLWIQGGPRARVFFAETPERAPALNKIPLIRWDPGYAFVSSTHMLLPRGLNHVYEINGGEKATGCLLHAKFLHTFVEKTREELERHEHFASSSEYRAYDVALDNKLDFWTPWSERYINWRQLELLGLISKGNWA